MGVGGTRDFLAKSVTGGGGGGMREREKKFVCVWPVRRVKPWVGKSMGSRGEFGYFN